MGIHHCFMITGPPCYHDEQSVPLRASWWLIQSLSSQYVVDAHRDDPILNVMVHDQCYHDWSHNQHQWSIPNMTPSWLSHSRHPSQSTSVTTICKSIMMDTIHTWWWVCGQHVGLPIMMDTIYTIGLILHNMIHGRYHLCLRDRSNLYPNHDQSLSSWSISSSWIQSVCATDAAIPWSMC